ncbi:c-type cytochrome [Neptuniibacter halophilus]|uniref:c-type cytochrome n=1 Tax=Neptuniibacter halophilus TaxID=651666 RepID=UPI002573E488|nr:cytochrome c [Neptuniibacter halophilus]
MNTATIKSRGWLPVLLGVVGLLSGCLETEEKVPGRWYTPSQLEQGEQVFLQNCARCHGAGAQGTQEWRKPLADGRYPPPPLNGTAHAWHHPLAMLKNTVAEGGVRLGGSMPGFAGTLSEAEQEAAIAYFQSKWPAEIYAAWLQRGGLK